MFVLKCIMLFVSSNQSTDCQAWAWNLNNNKTLEQLGVLLCSFLFSWLWPFCCWWCFVLYELSLNVIFVPLSPCCRFLGYIVLWSFVQVLNKPFWNKDVWHVSSAHIGLNTVLFIHHNQKFNKQIQETQKQYACLSVTYIICTHSSAQIQKLFCSVFILNTATEWWA